MPSIKILSESLKNKISAGEVIERPASVVKELIENSIDAQSTRIDIEIRSAGKRLIKVSDNGIGMSKDDLPMSIMPHATSKISSDDDLFNIQTLGFRGEALASISAVSKILISSAERDKDGLTMKFEGGEIKDSLPCSIRGTIIEVRELFFNTPARLKFLKTDFTENHHIIDTVINSSLCNHHIGFYLTIDKNETLQLSPVDNTVMRIKQVFGKEMVDKLISVKICDDNYEIEIFYGKDSFYHNRKYQYIFVNKRPIRDISLSRAIYNALGEIIPKDMHPSFFLFIELTPALVDFNVHPAKREVRFRDKSVLLELIAKAINEQSYKDKRDINLSPHDKYVYDDKIDKQQSYTTSSVQEQYIDYRVDDSFVTNHIHLGDTFIALSYEKGLLLLDYHAAHERINYEKLLNRKGTKISLLFPYTVELDANSYLTIKNNLSLLCELGIEVEDFGNNSIIVRAMPDFAVHADLDVLIKDLSEVLIKKDATLNNVVNPVDLIKSKIASTIACHQSLRGKGDSPNRHNIYYLLEDLNKTQNPDYCPHGRPTKIFISKQELLKKFKKV